MRSRIPAALGAATVAAFALAACSTGGDAPAGPAQDDDAPITVWVDDTRAVPAQEYAAAHPELGATVEPVDNTHGNIASQISLAVKAGKEVPDVVFLSYPDELANLVVNPVNYALPLDEAAGQDVLDGFAAGSLAGCTFGGKVYCLPNDLAQTVLYYDSALMQELGYAVPTTFDEWRDLGASLAADHPGYSLGSVSSRYGLNGYYGSSACPFNTSPDPTTAVIDVDALECTRVGDVLGPLLADGTVSTLDPFDPVVTKTVADGKLLAAIYPSWMGEYGIKPNAPAEGRWAVAPMPTWDGADDNLSGGVGGGVWVVSATAENRDAAVAFAVGMSTDVDVQTAAATYPAATAAADAWLAKVADDPWYAADPSDVYREAAGKISPSLGLVRYQVQLEDSFNATLLDSAGERMDTALEAFGDQAVQAAETAGYTVQE